jgi:hypothetical protein
MGTSIYDGPTTESAGVMSLNIHIAQDVQDNGGDSYSNEDFEKDGLDHEDIQSQESLVNIGDQKCIDDLDALKVEEQGL